MFANLQILNTKLDKRFNEFVTISNQSKEDIQTQAIAKSAMQLDGLKINLLLTDFKEKEPPAEGDINELDFFRKVDRVCGMEI